MADEIACDFAIDRDRVIEALVSLDELFDCDRAPVVKTEGGERGKDIGIAVNAARPRGTGGPTLPP